MTTAFYRDRSEIHGWGCFTHADLKPGSYAVCPNHRTGSPDRMTVWVDDAAYSLFAPFCFLNHSDDPNCELSYLDGHFYLEFIKEVPSGTELTFDYGEDWDD